jgi:penicillin-binding protein 2
MSARHDNDRYQAFTRRAALLFGGQLALFSGLAARMYYLQVVEADRYRMLAEDNRINFKLLAPRRGRIVDRFGRPLAINQQNYRVLLTPENTKSVEKTLDVLAEIIPINDKERQKILRDIKRRRRFLPMIVRENLDWDKVARIEVNAPSLPGISIDVGETRFYPDGSLTAPVLGYISGVAEAEQTGDPLLELPGFRIGKAGIEKTLDVPLRGRGGTSQVEVNAYGREIRELERVEGQPGAEARLTIDLELQKFVAERLGEESASCVVLDVHSGELLAMASTPSFDPNAFNRGLTAEEWRELSVNPRTPLNNKAIAGLYAPGSTFKMTVALAALERGIITPATRIGCPGKVSLGDATFHCWKKGGHGWLDLHGGLVNSCDCYFYEVARRIGVDRIAEMAERLGLGVLSEIELPGEKKGLMPTRAWKRAAKGSAWTLGETLISGIGQGYMMVTPLQLAVMCARIANGGRAVKPRLTHMVVPHDGESALPEPPRAVEDLGISPYSIDVVQKGMIGVMNSPGGTAFKARIKEPAFAMAGKTGSVQVRRISKHERETRVLKNEERPWHERDHALFVGYAPVSEPRYACAVVVEHGGGGSTAAAPIARDVLLEVQKRDPSRSRTVDLAKPGPERAG